MQSTADQRDFTVSSRSPSAQEQILGTWTDYAVEDNDCDTFQKWLCIKRDIDAIKGISDRRERRTKAFQVTLDMLTDILSLYNLFDKYPFIRAESYVYLKEVQLFSQYIDESVQAIEECSRKYFEHYFGQQNVKVTDIKFYPKISGVQFGRIAVVTSFSEETNVQQQITYYIKTHQHGSASGASSVKQVDPKEIFVYKVLEYIGLGPKAHFFQNPISKCSFYIATQDCGFSKDREKQNDKTFATYDKFKESMVVGEHIDDGVIRGITKADIISRMFYLRDVTSNSTNFGFVCRGEKKKCKIIDFRIETQRNYKYYGIFGWYLSGTGLMNYRDELLKFIFVDRPECDRLRTAEEVVTDLNIGIEGKKLSLIDAIDKAYGETLPYLDRDPEPLGRHILSSPDPALDFSQYYYDIKINIAEFTQDLNFKKASYQNSFAVDMSNLK